MSMTRFLFITILIVSPGLCAAQFTKLITVPVRDVVSATVDRPGELYLVDKKGVVQKMDVNGGLLEQFIPLESVLPTVLDGRDGARTFIYYRNRQEYAYLSPSLSNDGGWLKPDPAFAVAPYLVAPAGDYQLIILDSADWSLKKVNLRTPAVTVEESITPYLVKGSRITAMREYQNFIFVLDAAQGILVFNGIGKWIRTIPARNIDYFNFMGEEIYYRQDQTLTLIDLFTATSRQIALPVKTRYALLTDERLYAVQNDGVTIYTYTP